MGQYSTNELVNNLCNKIKCKKMRFKKEINTYFSDTYDFYFSSNFDVCSCSYTDSADLQLLI
jgi:hypothetical protein